MAKAAATLTQKGQVVKENMTAGSAMRAFSSARVAASSYDPACAFARFFLNAAAGLFCTASWKELMAFTKGLPIGSSLLLSLVERRSTVVRAVTSQPGALQARLNPVVPCTISARTTASTLERYSISAEERAVQCGALQCGALRERKRTAHLTRCIPQIESAEHGVVKLGSSPPRGMGWEGGLLRSRSHTYTS